MANFNLNDYVTVAERLAQAKDEIRTIHTDAPVMITEAMGYMRSTVILKDDRTATGTASFRFDLPNQRSAQATNPLEDCETSAIGRALGFLGYGSSKSVASREEVAEAMVRREVPATYQPRQSTPQAATARSAQPNGNTPMCDQCNIPARLGKDGKSYFCPNKDAHGGKWYTIPAVAAGATDTDLF